MSDTELVTLKHDSELSLQTVKDVFNLKAGEIDESFGVVPLSHPEDTDQVYVVTVAKEAAERMEQSGHDLFVKRFANSKISPFTPK